MVTFERCRVMNKEVEEVAFMVGDIVEKHVGEARYIGTIVARYVTLKSHDRYVVEVAPQGFQMIVSPTQIRLFSPLPNELEKACVTHTEAATTSDEAIEAMSKCDYWNGRKTLAEYNNVSCMQYLVYIESNGVVHPELWAENYETMQYSGKKVNVKKKIKLEGLDRFMALGAIVEKFPYSEVGNGVS